MPDGATKVCRLCDVEKPLETEFYFRKEKGGYYRTECKECVRARQRKYNATHEPPDRTEYHREWRAARLATPGFREAERARNRRQYWKNPAARVAASRRSRHRNPEPSRRAMRIYQQKKRGAPMDALANEWWGILRHDVCAYCGNRDRQSLDHIDAVARGGDSSWTNITPACGSCNASKQDRSLLEFLLHQTEVAPCRAAR